jgi:hypothetical protein
MPTDRFIVTRDEFNDGMQQQVDNIQNMMEVVNALNKAHNVLTEIVGLNRFILEKFVPRPLLEEATKEYKEQRLAMIKAETDGHDA